MTVKRYRKGSHTKYFSLCGPSGLSRNYSPLSLYYESHRIETKRHIRCVPIQLFFFFFTKMAENRNWVKVYKHLNRDKVYFRMVSLDILRYQFLPK